MTPRVMKGSSRSKEGNDFGTGQRKVHVVSPRTGFLSSRHYPDGEKCENWENHMYGRENSMWKVKI